MKATRRCSQQLAGFIARFDPAIGRVVRSARTILRQRFPTAVELVYDNYNALAIGRGGRPSAHRMWWSRWPCFPAA
jgi:hypothetical protein